MVSPELYKVPEIKLNKMIFSPIVRVKLPSNIWKIEKGET